LQPVCFVDDYAPYLMGVDERIHRVLITRDPDGSPNTGAVLECADACFPDLRAFVAADLEKPLERLRVKGEGVVSPLKR
jgi:hypothetical protein